MADTQLQAAARIAAEKLLIVFEDCIRLDGAERDDISRVRFLCQQIEDGERS